MPAERSDGRGETQRWRSRSRGVLGQASLAACGLSAGRKSGRWAGEFSGATGEQTSGVESRTARSGAVKFGRDSRSGSRNRRWATTPRRCIGCMRNTRKSPCRRSMIGKRSGSAERGKARNAERRAGKMRSAESWRRQSCCRWIFGCSKSCRVTAGLNQGCYPLPDRISSSSNSLLTRTAQVGRLVGCCLRAKTNSPLPAQRQVNEGA